MFVRRVIAISQQVREISFAHNCIPGVIALAYLGSIMNMTSVMMMMR